MGTANLETFKSGQGKIGNGKGKQGNNKIEKREQLCDQGTNWKGVCERTKIGKEKYKKGEGKGK